MATKKITKVAKPRRLHVDSARTDPTPPTTHSPKRRICLGYDTGKSGKTYFAPTKHYCTRRSLQDAI